MGRSVCFSGVVDDELVPVGTHWIVVIKENICAVFNGGLQGEVGLLRNEKIDETMWTQLR